MLLCVWIIRHIHCFGTASGLRPVSWRHSACRSLLWNCLLLRISCYLESIFADWTNKRGRRCKFVKFSCRLRSCKFVKFRHTLSDVKSDERWFKSSQWSALYFLGTVTFVLHAPLSVVANLRVAWLHLQQKFGLPRVQLWHQAIALNLGHCQQFASSLSSAHSAISCLVAALLPFYAWPRCHSGIGCSGLCSVLLHHGIRGALFKCPVKCE